MTANSKPQIPQTVAEWRRLQSRHGRLKLSPEELAQDETEARAHDRALEHAKAERRRAIFGFNPPRRWTSAQRKRAEESAK